MLTQMKYMTLIRAAELFSALQLSSIAATTHHHLCKRIRLLSFSSPPPYTPLPHPSLWSAQAGGGARSATSAELFDISCVVSVCHSPSPSNTHTHTHHQIAGGRRMTRFWAEERLANLDVGLLGSCYTDFRLFYLWPVLCVLHLGHTGGDGPHTKQ